MNVEEGVKRLTDESGTILIEREIGADDVLSEFEERLARDGYTIFRGVAEEGPVSVFEKAMPSDYSRVFKVDKPPRVLASYFISSTGIVLTSVEREESDLDADIFSGMLTAVDNFVSDSMSQYEGEESTGGLSGISYEDEQLGQVNIQMSKQDSGVLVVTYQGGSAGARDDLKETVDDLNVELHNEHSDELEQWDGGLSSPFVDQIHERIRNMFFDSKRYDGEMDLERLRVARMAIKEKVLDGVQKEYNSNDGRVVFLLDDVQNMDVFSSELFDYISRNTEIPFVCQYETDVLKEGIENEYLDKVIENLPEERCDQISVKSEKDIDEIVNEKLENVDERAFELIRYAAVAGKFYEDVLNSVSGIPKKEIEEIRTDLEKAGIIDGYKFSNSRLKERAIESILDDEKQEIDVKVANALIQKDENYPKIAELLLPYAEANEDNREKAIEYSIKAAEQFLQFFDTDKALDFYHNAIEIDNNNQRKMETLEDVLEIENITWKSKGYLKEFEKDISKLEKLAEKEEAVDKQAVAKLFDLKLYQSRENFDFQKALKKFEVVKEFAEKIKDKEMLTNAYVLAGIVNNKNKKFDEALEYYEKGLEIAEENNILTEKTKLLNVMGRVMIEKNNFDKAEGYFNEGLNLAKKLNTAATIPPILNNIIQTYFKKNEDFIKNGKYNEAEKIKEKALDLKEEALRWCDKTGNVINKYWITNNIAGILTEYPNEINEAESLYRNALKISEKLSLNTQQTIVKYNISELNFKKGMLYQKKVEEDFEKKEINENYKEAIENEEKKIFSKVIKEAKRKYPELFEE